MSFDDLPDNWSDLPLTEPRLVADVLDLVVTDSSRSSGALYVLLCDSQDRLLQPCAIDDVPTVCGDSDRERVLSAFVTVAAQTDAGLLIARARPGYPDPTPSDQRWLETARRVCDSENIRLLGVHVITPVGSRQLTPRDRAA